MADIAHAGRIEKSDIFIEVEKHSTAGSIDFSSSVQALFGTQILTRAQDFLTRVGLASARVKIVDSGALDFVILARLEAVARDLEVMPESGIWPEKKVTQGASARNRLRRTRLYLPGNNPDFMLNAGLFAPDCVILDLEDSVAPANKNEARVLVRNALVTIDFGAAERIVRINPLTTEFGRKDLEMIIAAGPDTILIPKCETARHVEAVVEIIERLESGLSLAHPIWVMPLIETAAGVWHANEIATASKRVCAITFGAEDFTADIGASRTPEGKESFVARSLLVLAAKAAGVQAIDTVFSDVQDQAGLIASTREAIALGFEGKGVIHPGQIKPIHDAFAPTAEQIDYARNVMAAMDEAQQRGSGVAALGTKMIDAPVVARAEKILRLARALKLISEN